MKEEGEEQKQIATEKGEENKQSAETQIVTHVDKDRVILSGLSLCVCVSVCVCVCVRVRVDVHVHACVFMRPRVHLHARVCACVRVLVHACSRGRGRWAGARQISSGSFLQSGASENIQKRNTIWRHPRP